MAYYNKDSYTSITTGMYNTKMTEGTSNYEFTRETFLGIVRNRISKTQFRANSSAGGFAFIEPKSRIKGSEEKAKFFVSLNANDPIHAQAVSLTHEAVHIDRSDKFSQMNFNEELFVDEQAKKFVEEHPRTSQGAINYLKVKNGVGIQIPLRFDST